MPAALWLRSRRCSSCPRRHASSSAPASSRSPPLISCARSERSARRCSRCSSITSMPTRTATRGPRAKVLRPWRPFSGTKQTHLGHVCRRHRSVDHRYLAVGQYFLPTWHAQRAEGPRRPPPLGPPSRYPPGNQRFSIHAQPSHRQRGTQSVPVNQYPGVSRCIGSGTCVGQT